MCTYSYIAYHGQFFFLSPRRILLSQFREAIKKATGLGKVLIDIMTRLAEWYLDFLKIFSRNVEILKLWINFAKPLKIDHPIENFHHIFSRSSGNSFSLPDLLKCSDLIECSTDLCESAAMRGWGGRWRRKFRKLSGNGRRTITSFSFRLWWS